MKINNKLFATSLLPLAALGYVGVTDVDATMTPSTEVSNACPLSIVEASITQEDEEVFFVGCGGFF